MGTIGMRGGVGMRTSAASFDRDVDDGGTSLRRTFAVGRLTRRSAELRLARGMESASALLRRVGSYGRARQGVRTIH